MSHENMKVAICAIAKNEASYIEEWIFYHKLIGFDDVFVYDNISDDGTSELLAAMHYSSDITRVHWPRVHDVPPQRHAYNHFLECHARAYDYILICDIDEFLYVEFSNVKEFIAQAEKRVTNLGAIAIPWLMYGPNGKLAKEPGLVIERFNASKSKVNSEVKSLFNPSKAFNMRTHICDLIEGVYLDNSFEVAKWGDRRPIDLKSPAKNQAVICHFYTKSKEEWMLRRAGRKADRAHAEFRDLNEFEKFNNAITPSNLLTSYVSDVEKSVKEARARLEQNSLKLLEFKVHRFDSAWVFFTLKFDREVDSTEVRIILNDNEEHVLRTISKGKKHVATLRIKWKIDKLVKFTAIIPRSMSRKTFHRRLSIPPSTTLSFLVEDMPSAEETIFEYFIKSLKISDDRARALSFSYPQFSKFPMQGLFLKILLESYKDGVFHDSLFLENLLTYRLKNAVLADLKKRLEKIRLREIAELIEISD